jgi:hypothetical protein
MAGRYTYSPYEVDPHQDQRMGSMQSGPRRFFSAVGRFFYRLVVLTLIVGAIGGVLFALYRNDVLLGIARGADVEAQYRSLEQRIGAPGWGTPRSIDLPAETPVAANKDTADRQPETVRAAATSESSHSTPDGLPIVSFDSLPTAPSKNAAPEAISLSALPAAPARRDRVEPTRTARAEPAPPKRAKAQKAEPAEPAPVTRSIPLPKAPPKPEPVAKAEPEPEPKPEPPAPKPAPEVDRTKPRANDNPLKAAIRAAMADKKASE